MWFEYYVSHVIPSVFGTSMYFYIVDISSRARSTSLCVVKIKRSSKETTDCCDESVYHQARTGAVWIVAARVVACGSFLVTRTHSQHTTRGTHGDFERQAREPNLLRPIIVIIIIIIIIIDDPMVDAGSCTSPRVVVMGRIDSREMRISQSEDANIQISD